MAPLNEAAAKSTKLVKSKSSAVVAVGEGSAKNYQKFKNSTRGKSHSTARKPTPRKKKNVSSKRTLDDNDDVDSSDDSDIDYVPSRSVLRRNVAESEDERISDGAGVESTASCEAMEDELESGMDKVQ